MKVPLYGKTFFFLFILLWAFACNKKSLESSAGTWQAFGFKDKSALRLVLAEPYLYVCSGSNGLWRRDIRQNSDYEYLEFANPNYGDYLNRGVIDVLTHPDSREWLLVALQPNEAIDRGVFKSFDGGISWVPADSGLEVYYGGERAYKRIQRFLFYPDYILGIGEGVYFTRNFGDRWEKINAPPGVSGTVLEQHVKFKDIVWAGGESLVFSPLLSKSSNGGFAWQGFDLIGQGVPLDNAVYSIAFDPEDANTVYVGMQGAIIKTMDSGQTWIVPLVTRHRGEWFRSIESDPKNRNHFWASAGKTLIETFDGGQTWREIQSPNEFQILDILWDGITQSLYVATERGIFLFIP